MLFAEVQVRLRVICLDCFATIMFILLAGLVLVRYQLCKAIWSCNLYSLTLSLLFVM